MKEACTAGADVCLFARRGHSVLVLLLARVRFLTGFDGCECIGIFIDSRRFSGLAGRPSLLLAHQKNLFVWPLLSFPDRIAISESFPSIGICLLEKEHLSKLSKPRGLHKEGTISTRMKLLWSTSILLTVLAVPSSASPLFQVPSIVKNAVPQRGGARVIAKDEKEKDLDVSVSVGGTPYDKNRDAPLLDDLNILSNILSEIVNVEDSR
ncbi:predicted protein, partial [Phaeodactylum tricornutum CCAP 1055/1]